MTRAEVRAEIARALREIDKRISAGSGVFKFLEPASTGLLSDALRHVATDIEAVVDNQKATDAATVMIPPADSLDAGAETASCGNPLPHAEDAAPKRGYAPGLTPAPGDPDALAAARERHKQKCGGTNPGCDDRMCKWKPEAKAARAYIAALESAIAERDAQLFKLGGHHIDDECTTCGVRDCVGGEPLHYHHDGCPYEYGQDQRLQAAEARVREVEAMNQRADRDCERAEQHAIELEAELTRAKAGAGRLDRDLRGKLIGIAANLVRAAAGCDDELVEAETVRVLALKLRAVADGIVLDPPRVLDDAELDRLTMLAYCAFYDDNRLPDSLAGHTDWKRTVRAILAAADRIYVPSVEVIRSAITNLRDHKSDAYGTYAWNEFVDRATAAVHAAIVAPLTGAGGKV